MRKSVLFVALFPFLLTNCTFLQKEADLHSGMTISKSITIRKDTFRIDAPDSFTTPVLLIEGNNITVDFNGAVLVGSNEKKEPDKFFGLAILVKTGKNVTIKNATASRWPCSRA